MNLTKKKYLKMVYDLLPCHGKNEKRFYNDFEESVNEFSNSNSIPDNNAFITEFGHPQEVAAEFIRSQPTEYLLNQINKNKWRKRGVFFLTLIIIIELGVFSMYCHKAYIDAKTSVITQEETYITTLP